MVKKKQVSFEVDEILRYFDALENPRSTINLTPAGERTRSASP